jgi:large subunit ribosomal protein L3
MKLAKIDKDNNLLLIAGAVPGPNGSYVMVKETNKVGQAAPQDSKSKEKK